jgi:hypothetical protein
LGLFRCIVCALYFLFIFDTKVYPSANTSLSSATTLLSLYPILLALQDNLRIQTLGTYILVMQSPNVSLSYYKEDENPLTDEESLSTGLIGAPAAGSVPAVKGQSLMQVTAPATLPEGYEFPVTLGSLKFPVKVPPGGVEEGQVFTVPIPTTSIPQIHTTSIPVGAWRDDLDGCFNYGACHPHFWTACFCSLRTLMYSPFLNFLELYAPLFLLTVSSFLTFFSQQWRRAK